MEVVRRADTRGISVDDGLGVLGDHRLVAVVSGATAMDGVEALGEALESYNRFKRAAINRRQEERAVAVLLRAVEDYLPAALAELTELRAGKMSDDDATRAMR